jgi:hypothetical protein
MTGSANPPLALRATVVKRNPGRGSLYEAKADLHKAIAVGVDWHVERGNQLSDRF